MKGKNRNEAVKMFFFARQGIKYLITKSKPSSKDNNSVLEKEDKIQLNLLNVYFDQIFKTIAYSGFRCSSLEYYG